MGEGEKGLIPEFYLEGSLHGLGKWLRFLGYRCSVCEKTLDLKEIIANRDKTFLITSLSTAEVLKKLGLNYLVLPRQDLKAQLRLVITKFNLNTELTLDICSVCGHRLIPVEKEKVKDSVPPRVYKSYDEFNLCPGCGRIYWEGDHVQRLKSKLKKLIGGVKL